MTFRDPLQPKPFSEHDIPVGQVEEELPLDTQQWELGEHRSITLDNAKILRYWVNQNFIFHGIAGVFYN